MSPAPRGELSGPAAESLRRVRALAVLLDQRYRIPGTPIRFGLDGLLGLLPGAGDAAGAALSLWLLWEARRLRVRKGVWARMGANLLLDALLGSVPLAGDAFDVWFKANARNVRLLERELSRSGFQPPSEEA